MKNFIKLLVLCTCFVGLQSSIHSDDFKEYTLHDIESESCEEFMESNCRLHSNCILHIQEGDEVPFNLIFAGDTLAIQNPSSLGKIIALKHLYIKNDNGEFTFSTDKAHWKDVDSFISGMLELKFSRDDRDLLQGTINFTLNTQ